MIRDILVAYIHGQHGSLETGHQLLELLQCGESLEIILKQSGLMIKRAFELLRVCQNSDSMQPIYDLYQEKGIHILTIIDEKYPDSLRHVTSAPLVLFYKGDISLFSLKKLAVVGQDNLTLYGKRVIDELIIPLPPDVVFVGCLHARVSALLFEQAIKYQCKSLLVLNVNFEQYEPLKYMFLQKKLEKIGLVVTEVPLGDRQQKSLQRIGELVASMSSCVCVVETSQRTLAMFIAYCGIEKNKDIIVAPVSLFEEYGVGNNLLLQQGSYYLMERQDIIDCLNQSEN